MKFKFGDIVYHVPFAKAYPSGIDYLQILGYDSVKQMIYIMKTMISMITTKINPKSNKTSKKKIAIINDNYYICRK